MGKTVECHYCNRPFDANYPGGIIMTDDTCPVCSAEFARQSALKESKEPEILTEAD